MNINKTGESMSIAVAINSSGQATIPKVVRDLLNVVPGENRLVFDITDGKVELRREPSRAELLDATLSRIWSQLDEKKRKNPKLARNAEKYQGMTFSEVRESHDTTLEGREAFEEKYGIKI